MTYVVNFVTAHHADSMTLRNQAGIPQGWVLAWPADESNWQSTIATIKGQLLRLARQGNTRCQGIVGCFTGPDPFLASGTVALFSAQNFFQYNGQTGVAIATILLDQYSGGANESARSRRFSRPVTTRT